jgi:probable phosphoglycerate mutase
MGNLNLILARHGNTFNPNDKVTWVGSRNDLPLVHAGIQQAKHLAESFLWAGITLDAIFCGPLTRTRRFADIVKKTLDLPYAVTIDKRLNELDYGEWSGLTDTEVIEKFGSEFFDNWSKYGVWPAVGSWGQSESEIRDEVASFAQDLLNNYRETSNILAVSSSGRLRYFLTLVEGLWERSCQASNLKVGTGRICLSWHNGASWQMSAWNIDAKEAGELLCAAKHIEAKPTPTFEG